VKVEDEQWLKKQIRFRKRWIRGGEKLVRGLQKEIQQSPGAPSNADLQEEIESVTTHIEFIKVELITLKEKLPKKKSMKRKRWIRPAN